MCDYHTDSELLTQFHEHGNMKMKDWKEYRIKDICEIIDGDRGKNYPQDSDFYDEGFCLFLNAGNVTKNGWNFNKVHFITKEKDTLLRKGKASVNDIIMTTRGTVGNFTLFDNQVPYSNMRINSGMVIIRTIETIDKYFLLYLFQSDYVQNLIKLFCSGSAQPQLPIKDFNKIKLSLPPLPTQQKIASILSAYDNLIQNYKKQIEALQSAASELYKEWFVRFRFPGYQTTKFENGIPEGWKVYLIKDLCYINKKTVSSKDAKKEILYLDTGSITENVIDSFESYILEEAPSRARRIVKKNSIIFSTVRPNQNHYGILKTVPENLIVSTGFAVFDPKFDIANILYFFLSSKDFVDYCQMIAEGAVVTYPSIKPEEIGKVKILLPTMDLAIKLNHSFESLFLRIENLKQQITNLTQQRDLLLPRLMSGKLEV